MHILLFFLAHKMEDLEGHGSSPPMAAFTRIEYKMNLIFFGFHFVSLPKYVYT